MSEEAVVRILKEEEIGLISHLPCDRAGLLCSMITSMSPHVPLLREEDGVGVSAGAYLAGIKPAMVIQSSGLGNMLNALLSLHGTFHLPLPIITSWRGVYQEAIPAQVPFNSRLPEILRGAGIPYATVMDADELPRFREMLSLSFAEMTPTVTLISPACFTSGACPPPDFPDRSRTVAPIPGSVLRTPLMTRYDAIAAVAPHLGSALCVSNIGVPSKELYAISDRPENFYMLGSYTQASPIALGLALSTDREVVVIDGDGSLLGSAILPVIASLGPKNLTIICLDNGTFGSTGNQITQGYATTDLAQIAAAAGIRQCVQVQTAEELDAALRAKRGGPWFIHVIIRPGNADVPNIPLSPIEIRNRFMEAASTTPPFR
ncbi:MAG: sulfopyruvate decarboxylase subunit beta [Methanocalculus sp. MSAO_Arc1]|uniref:sulfopyruvate decarboxylase subunit beta n=1 Tax=Methanocalculus TaxID=71151 RepID=UPI000FF3E050|nr:MULTISPECIES: sulfopyruvate decarboxylase subunit beta [unclassified Methanocalculus]MCP1661492.1 sulfopyruvate decarboxylase subunit beta [Methanocalculus sp. AMF5]RQD79768.1 MAG: sulfopyruvate decarboxylase subunit beta [Methanocalculus sp. MSAO_Arc1]